MNKNKKNSVRVPTLDPVMLNADLLKGIADDCQGINGWAYRKIRDLINVSFQMGHNPLETLRKFLPQWQWSVCEAEWQTTEELEAAVNCFWCGYCGNGVPKGAYGEEMVLCQWSYHHTDPTETRVFHVVATRPTEDLGFACKTAGKPGEYEPQWVLVDGREAVGIENDWNTQSHTTISARAGRRTFRHFAGLIPAGTRPIPVEKIGRKQDWEEGSPYNSGQWGRCGYETHYRMPDGSTATRSVTTDEW